MNGRMYSVYSGGRRNPVHIALDEGGDRADEVVDRQLRQVQTLGGVLETLGVRIRTEQLREPSATIGLQTFEAFLGVMQNRCAWPIFSGAYGSIKKRSDQPSPWVQVMWAMLSEKT